MTRTRNMLGWLASLLVVPGALAAQNPGDTVRVNGETVAQFQRADSSGVYLDTGFIPFDQLGSLEIRTGFKRKTVAGVFLGAATGLAVPMVGSSLTCPGDGSDLGCVAAWGIIALVGVPTGAVVGGVVGYSKKSPIFEPVAFTLVNWQRGIGVGFRLRF